MKIRKSRIEVFMKKSLETTYLHIQAVHNGGKPLVANSGLDFQTEKELQTHSQAAHMKKDLLIANKILIKLSN